MTPGREHEIEVARGQRYEPDRILSFDRAYVDYPWFDQLHRQGGVLRDPAEAQRALSGAAAAVSGPPAGVGG